MVRIFSGAAQLGLKRLILLSDRTSTDRQAVDDAASTEVVGSHFNPDAIARQDFDK
ncbi:MAG: hypothetical protein WBG38_01960 [Nodosilinea sp.]